MATVAEQREGTTGGCFGVGPNRAIATVVSSIPPDGAACKAEERASLASKASSPGETASGDDGEAVDRRCEAVEALDRQ